MQNDNFRAQKQTGMYANKQLNNQNQELVANTYNFIMPTNLHGDNQEHKSLKSIKNLYFHKNYDCGLIFFAPDWSGFALFSTLNRTEMISFRVTCIQEYYEDHSI